MKRDHQLGGAMYTFSSLIIHTFVLFVCNLIHWFNFFVSSFDGLNLSIHIQWSMMDKRWKTWFWKCKVLHQNKVYLQYKNVIFLCRYWSTWLNLVSLVLVRMRVIGLYDMIIVKIKIKLACINYLAFIIKQEYKFSTM